MTSTTTQAPATARDYRVQLVIREVYDLWVTATDAGQAIDQAEAAWLNVGPDGMHYRDGGIDAVDVLTEREVQS
ncbi:hypothetical protein GGD81_004613 [Rhodobium orientis]|uniref:hypothetical protein n=1 Tax=Rhodobium orientis TaxID=34017 RepID=UPI000DACA5E1|nr:hypothetical protein [Rhodobium orientis]MBB4305533.1 hypothetical protein [Rhodobium orientis]